MAGLLVFGAVASTDWLDGYIARRTGQVSELGTLLDPLADRLAIGAALVCFILRGAFPLWAALLVLVRDVVVLAAAAALAAGRKVRVEVRPMGKAATFALMAGVAAVAWSNFGLALHGSARVGGWILFGAGAAAYYLVAALYAMDLRRGRVLGVGDDVSPKIPGPDRRL